MLEFLSGVMAKLQGGDENALEEPTTSEGWGLRALMHLIDVYVEGKTDMQKFERALTELINCLRKQDDPLVKSLQPTERMMLLMGLNQMRAIKEKVANGRQGQEA